MARLRIHIAVGQQKQRARRYQHKPEDQRQNRHGNIEAAGIPIGFVVIACAYLLAYKHRACVAQTDKERKGKAFDGRINGEFGGSYGKRYRKINRQQQKSMA